MVCNKLMVIVFVTLVAACQAKQSDTQVVAPTISATTPSESSASSNSANKPAGNAMENQAETGAVEQRPITAAGKALLPGLKEGMAYADFRKLVLANGWTPVVTPECVANVVGGDYASVCKANPEQISCRICELMPELDSYSGDGYSLVRFRHAADGEQVEATGYGMIEDWDVSGDDSRLQVMGWEFSKSPTQ
jgi:hypothetical protein